MRVRRPIVEDVEIDDAEDFEEELDDEESDSQYIVQPQIIRGKKRNVYESEYLPPLIKFPAHLPRNEQRPWKREALLYLRAFLAEGLSRTEIMERMGIESTKVYDKLEYRLMETDGARFVQMGTAHRYYIHSLRTEQLVRELDQFVRTHMKDDPRKSGVVGAIKAKAQLYKDMIVMGQELGIIDKRAKELRVLGEINLGALPNEELRELLEKRLEWFQNVMTSPQKLPSAHGNILERSVRQIEENDVVDAEWEEEETSEAQEEDRP